MPWKDASKPGDQPGPWDTPGEVAPGRVEDVPSRRPEPSAPAASPWDAGRPETPPSSSRRTERGKPPRPVIPPPARGPDLDELGRQLRLRLAGSALRPSGRRGWLGILGGAAVGLLAGWMASGTFLVRPGQVALVTRWGEPTAQLGPGLHYHWPAPIGASHSVSLGTVNRLDLGSGDPSDATGPLLTREGDLLGVAYTVEWRVADLRRYLSAAADPRATVGAAAREGMRQAVGATPVADLLSASRGGVAERAARRMQAALDRVGAGVSVVGVDIREVQAPDAAQGALHDLSAAADDADLARRDGDAYRARVLAEAHADAAKMVQASQGYRDQEVSEAKGEAERFTRVDAEYRKAPGVTRDRLYTETMERLLHGTPKIIVQLPKGAAAQINLPPDALRPKPAEAPSASAPPPANAAQGAPGSAAPPTGGPSGPSAP